MKTLLDLPPIESRPPIPPRIYSKLYSYFDRTLISNSARQRAAREITKAGVESVKSLPQRHTPSRAKSLEGFRKNHRTPKKGLQFSASKDKEEKIPRWVAPSIRLLCRELETPKAVPHVLAGVESILTLPPPDGSDGAKADKLVGLIAAVWFFVVIRLRGESQQGKENLQRKKLARDVLAKAREDRDVLTRAGTDENDWAGWEAVEERDVNNWRKEIVAKGWRQMDWFENIAEGSGVEGIVNVELTESEDDSEGDYVPERRRGRPGTMHQDKYDYLSATKQREYENWRLEMLSKIEGLLAEATDEDGMDIVDD
jgi:origin recognition complex subunit 6